MKLWPSGNCQFSIYFLPKKARGFLEGLLADAWPQCDFCTIVIFARALIV